MLKFLGDDQYRYAAFISYSHRDMKVGRYLQKALENYSLPRSWRKDRIPGKMAPKHVRPFFRDETELIGGALNPQLIQGLTYSKYLVVICSPNACVKNDSGINWIEIEIDCFQYYGCRFCSDCMECSERKYCRDYDAVIEDEKYKIERPLRRHERKNCHRILNNEITNDCKDCTDCELKKRATRIVPYIAMGKVTDFSTDPNAKPKDRCCYPSNLDRSLLGVDAQKFSRERAIIGVISCVLGCKSVDDLVRRHEAQRKQVRLIVGSSAAIVVSLTWLWLYAYVLKYNHYYEDYVVRYNPDKSGREFGIHPEGILPELTKAQVKRAHDSWCLVTKGRWGSVVELKHVNSEGQVAAITEEEERKERPVHMELKYLEDGSIGETIYDPYGECLRYLSYKSGKFKIQDKILPCFIMTMSRSEKSNYTIGLLKDTTRGFSLSEYSSLTDERCYIDTMHLVPNEQGFLERRVFYDGQDRVQCDINGLSEYLYEVDELGRRTKEAYYVYDSSTFSEKQITLPSTGVCERRLLYYDTVDGIPGRLRSYTSYAREGSKLFPVEDGNSGWITCEYTYDEDGNVVEQRNKDQDGHLVLCSGGYAIEKDSFVGDSSWQRYYDCQGRPCYNRALDGLWSAQNVITYDEQGNHSSIKYYDATPCESIEQLKPINNEQGYHSVVYTRDAKGRLLSATYRDMDNLLCNNLEEGYCRRTITYEEKEVESNGTREIHSFHTTRYFGVDISSADNKRTEQIVSFFRAGYYPEDNGYHAEIDEYNEVGNIVSRSYFNEELKPTVNGAGVHRYEYEYEPDKGCNNAYNLTATSCFGLPTRQGESIVYQPCLHDNSYHREELKYLGDGLLCSIKYKDINNNLTAVPIDDQLDESLESKRYCESKTIKYGKIPGSGDDDRSVINTVYDGDIVGSDSVTKSYRLSGASGNKLMKLERIISKNGSTIESAKIEESNLMGQIVRCTFYQDQECTKLLDSCQDEAELLCSYDERNRLKTEARLNCQGAKKRYPPNTAIETLIKEQALFAPPEDTAEQQNWAIKKYEYDERDREIVLELCAANGKRLKQIITEYDKHGIPYFTTEEY